ncbi:DUF664 domain-containing protein [bacterium]|nr:DUF664 domain-containing protein [bacterium]
MSIPPARAGRPRRYDLKPAPGISNRDAALHIAALDECSDRLIDLIRDLPPESLDYLPEGGRNTIAMLVRHMAWAEASWVSRLTDRPTPAELEEALRAGQQEADSGELEALTLPVQALIGLCRKVRDEITRPALAELKSIDEAKHLGDRTVSLRSILMHLIWHWTYHSGQVGLLRRLAGTRYQWTFDERMTARGFAPEET